MLKVIKCSDNPVDCTFEKLYKSLTGKDEFSEYRLTKCIRKEEERVKENLRKGVVKEEEGRWN